MAVTFATNPLVDELLQPEDIHEEYRQPLTGIFLFLLVGAILTVAHALNIYFFILHTQNLGMFLLVHLVLTVMAFIYAKSQDREGHDPRFGYLITVMALVLGPLGALGTVCSAMMVGFFNRFSLDFKTWFATLFPRRSIPKVEQLYDDIILGRDENGKNYSVQSFSDVISVGTDAQKRIALGRMTAAFRAEFAPAFQLALQDNSPSVRVQAATSITKIENMFYDRLVKLQTLAEHYPKRAEVKKALALHYDDYAFTGLLDPYREAQNRERARAIYLEYLAQVPGDILVRQNIGRLLVRSGKAREAVDWFKACIDGGQVNDTIKLWYFECLFDARDYNRLRDAVFTLPVNFTTFEEEKPALADTIRLWQQERGLRITGTTPAYQQ